MENTLENLEKKLWEELADAVVEMDEKRVIVAAEEVLKNSFSPESAIFNGLSEGMNRVGEKFAENYYFVPELLICADAMKAGISILKNYIEEEKSKIDATVVIGVVEGDFHDIGKNIVSILIQSAGFRVIDLGHNISVEKFLSSIHDENPDIVAISTLMTTTMKVMENVVKSIKTNFDENRPKIMVGGAPVTKVFSDNIGADFFGENAQEAVIGVKKLLQKA